MQELQAAMGASDPPAAQCRLLAGPWALGAQLLLAALALASLLYKRWAHIMPLWAPAGSVQRCLICSEPVACRRVQTH